MEQFASAKKVFGTIRGQRAVEYKIFLRQHPTPLRKISGPYGPNVIYVEDEHKIKIKVSRSRPRWPKGFRVV